MKTNTVADLKIKLSRVRNERDYWRRRALTPGSEAERKAHWRRENPAKYSLELLRNKVRSKLRRLP